MAAGGEAEQVEVATYVHVAALGLGDELGAGEVAGAR
jgi:hypothetical protein